MEVGLASGSLEAGDVRRPAGKAASAGRRRERVCFLVMGIVVLLTTFMFFTRVCPLVPSDSDDWVLMAKTRTGLPEWGAFNPSKVLPETSLHAVNFVAAFVFMPLVGGDYVWSLVVAAAALVSVLVTIYALLFALLLRRQVGTGLTATVCVTALFYLAHFVLLSHTGGGAVPYLLGSRDFTGYFHYTVPYLVCASCVFGIALRGPGIGPRDGRAEGNASLALLVLGIYLGMFSNLFLNIVLAAFSGACLVASLAHVGDRRGDRWSLSSYLKANALHFCVLALWVLTLAFELSGNRASGALEDGGGFHLGAVLADLAAELALLDRRLVALLAVGMAGAAATLLVSRRAGRPAAPRLVPASRLVFVCVMALCLTTLFDVLLSSVMDPYTQTIPPIRYYASRPDVLVGMALPCLVLGCFALGLVMTHVRLVTLVAPVVAFVVAVSAVNCIGRYEQPVRGGITAGSTLAAARDMVGQIEAADRNGQSSVEVHILAFQNDFAPNWPLMPGMGDSVSECLYTAGVTSQRIEVTLVPDEDVNERLGLPREIGASAGGLG